MKMYKRKNSIGKTDRNKNEKINSDLDGVKTTKK